MTETADITRATRRLRGTPETVAAELAGLLGAYPIEPRGEGVTARDRLRHREATEAHWLQVFARRRWLLDEFCRRNGWRWRQDDHFTRAMLAERRKRRRLSDDDYRGWSDHDYFLRDAAGLPVAVVGHPYDLGTVERRAALARGAVAHGLQATFPDDFPSWWYPGRTTIVVFERPWNRMPVLRSLDDVGSWWSVPRREPFGHDDVLSRVPWPGEADALVDVRAMVDEIEGSVAPFTMTIERLHILHERHPSAVVRLRAWSALVDAGKADVADVGDD